MDSGFLKDYEIKKNSLIIVVIKKPLIGNRNLYVKHFLTGNVTILTYGKSDHTNQYRYEIEDSIQNVKTKVE